MKHVTAVYFSPTGGTKTYVCALAEKLDENYTAVDLTSPAAREREYAFGPDDMVIFGAPVYAGRLPILPSGLYDRIRGDNTPAICAVTYGNREFDDALLEMKDICESRGFSCIAAAAWLAQHTYSDKLAGGRPDPADLQETLAFAEKIKEKLKAGNTDGPEIPGNHPYREGKRLPMHTEPGDRCTECGFCAGVCPAGAIRNGAGMEADGEKCIGCLACVKRCPRGARLVNDPELAAVREKLEPAFGGVHKENRYFLQPQTGDGKNK